LALKNFVTALGASIFSACVLLGGAAHAELIKNGGFEDGDFGGWQQFGQSDSDLVMAEPSYTQSGDYAAFFGSVGSFSGITQRLQTTAGQGYILSYWLRNLGASTLNEESVSFSSVSIDNVVQSVSLLDNKEPSDFIRYEVAFAASSDATDIQFAFRQDDAFWVLDDVSVNTVDGTAEVPEPGTLPLALIALAGCVLMGAKRSGMRGSFE
jgi:hypothetical protein